MQKSDWEKPQGRANRYDAHCWAYFFYKYNVDYTKQARERVYSYEKRMKENGNRI